MIWSGCSLNSRPPPASSDASSASGLVFSFDLTAGLNPFAGGRLEFLLVFLGFAAFLLQYHNFGR
jgi:hypothetical protein